jgi:hypothetical protein
MNNLPKGQAPVETNGLTGDVSKNGVYVFEPTDSLNNKLGEKKFLEAIDPSQADAFIHMGYRGATEAETREYRSSANDAKKEVRESLSAPERKAEEASDKASGLPEQTNAKKGDK